LEAYLVEAALEAGVWPAGFAGEGGVYFRNKRYKM
jgi:hypothetical protein